jgi:hypothetical protein
MMRMEEELMLDRVGDDEARTHFSGRGSAVAETETGLKPAPALAVSQGALSREPCALCLVCSKCLWRRCSETAQQARHAATVIFLPVPVTLAAAASSHYSRVGPGNYSTLP